MRLHHCGRGDVVVGCSRRLSCVLLVVVVAVFLIQTTKSFSLLALSSVVVRNSDNHHHHKSTTRISRLFQQHQQQQCHNRWKSSGLLLLRGWVQQQSDGEWTWIEDDPAYVPASTSSTTTAVVATDDGTQPQQLLQSSATPQLPSKMYRPKQSLGQNYLKDPNTVAKIIRAFHKDATTTTKTTTTTTTTTAPQHIVELGPGAGALTDKLIEVYGVNALQCIEIDERSVTLLQTKHPQLNVMHADVLQINYAQLAIAASASASAAASQQNETNPSSSTSTMLFRPLTIIGNLPYYITSQILFALADATHVGAISTATVTMQYEVAQRIVATPNCKEYGILSVVFQLYCQSIQFHFKIPPTVFYPQPKVDSALLGFHFVSPTQLQQRLGIDVLPEQLRRVVTATFQQRRKTIRNSIRKLCLDIYNHNTTKVDEILNSIPLPLPSIIQEAADAGDTICQNAMLPQDWSTKRPEQLSPGQFVQLTRLVFDGNRPRNNNNDNDNNIDANPPILLGTKVWRKLKHGTNE